MKGLVDVADELNGWISIMPKSLCTFETKMEAATIERFASRSQPMSRDSAQDVLDDSDKCPWTSIVRSVHLRGQSSTPISSLL